MRFKIVILSANPRNLAACIYSVLANEPDLRASDIIVVDDGAFAGAKELIPAGIRRISGIKPFVFARNANLGIASAGDYDVFLLNDDARLQTPHGITNIARKVYECKSVAIASPMVRGACGNIRQHEGMAHGFVIEPEKLCFIGVYLPRHILTRIGPLDERFIGYGFDDDDYSIRARLAGFNLAIYSGCVLDHGSLTPSFRGTDGFDEKAAFNRHAFHEKWLGRLAFPTRSPPLLSILIPSLESRKRQREELLATLNTQRSRLADPWSVEIRTAIDQKQKTVGKKRNELQSQALGLYRAFVDDDDEVTGNYIESLVAAIASNRGVDVVAFDGWVTWDGKYVGQSNFDMKWGRNQNIELPDGMFEYRRIPNHLCAVRTELARAAAFPETNCGEDTEHAERLLPLIKTQVRIDKVLYGYRFSPTMTETQREAAA